MRDYLRKNEWVLQEVSFRYLDGLYRGRGLLTWVPEAGFQLEAFVDRSGPPLPSPIQLGHLRLLGKADTTSIRMKLQHGPRAVTYARLADRLDLLAQSRLSARLGRVFFMRRLNELSKGRRWSGSALFDAGGSIFWPDKVTRTLQLEGETIGVQYAREGLVEKTAARETIGYIQDDGLLEVHWGMDRSHYRKADCWRWPEALRDALSIVLGASVVLLERQSRGFPREHVERRKRIEIQSLAPFRFFDDEGPVEKTRLFALAEFFLGDAQEAKACRKIFEQMVQASRETRWGDHELQMATILEGTLRFLDRVPYTDKSWDLRQSLVQFRDKRLAPLWRVACNHAHDTFVRMRAKRAHPDWSLDDADPRSEDERRQGLKDMLFLSRFYGYMILALAGFKDLDPVFQGRRMASTKAAPGPAGTPPAGSALM